VRRRALLACAPFVLASAIAACSSPGSGTSAGGADASGKVVNVTASEFKFDPSTVSLAAGKVTFHVRNGGAAEHEFEVLKGDQRVGEIEGLVPGLEKDLTVELAAGSYSFVCRLPGHEEQGMKGTITVTP
jgi:iron uptake system component EfeO